MPVPLKVPDTAQAPFRDDGRGTTQPDLVLRPRFEATVLYDVLDWVAFAQFFRIVYLRGGDAALPSSWMPRLLIVVKECRAAGGPNHFT